MRLIRGNRWVSAQVCHCFLVGLFPSFCLGKHRQVFVINREFLSKSASANAWFNHWPALPTKGLPITSSSFPGASPTIKILEFKGPSGFILGDIQEECKGQLTQSEKPAILSSDCRKAI